ncbi:MAG: hypothetical protein QM713_07125 [Arachnia sp.]
MTAAGRARDERGSAGGLLTLGICAAVLAVSLVVMVVVAWVSQARRAEQAAELAALAAATASVRGEAPCGAAAEAARRNGTEVAACVLRGGGKAVVVEVTIEVSLTPAPPWGAMTLRREATAGT